jgi:hypothetical protein
MHQLRYRQVHLDFHTSPQIPRIGVRFDKAAWQKTLAAGHVDSITTFSKCHHGWSYHPTSVGKMHPHLDFDLLRAQFEACKEMDVNVPIYLSAGVDNVASDAHPEWREITSSGTYAGWVGSPLQPGFHKMCFNTPYLDYLCEQIREAVRLFPGCDGIFLDIISQGECCCKWCMQTMAEAGLDPQKAEDRQACAAMSLEKYYCETTAAARCDNPDMPVFHNSGHIPRGKRSLLKYFSHLELESLPTGGWGYDHFPISAKYCRKLDHDFLGMTGKFHTTWGEFGGYKHPNALRYECAAMLAFGAKCSVGDQLHPEGELDASTYNIIGAAYAEVEQKEEWCRGAVNVADIGVLSLEAVQGKHDDEVDFGTGRILLENHFLFDLLDADMDFAPYRMLILPDRIPVGPELKEKLSSYLRQGGKLMLSGASGLADNGNGFIFDIGAEHAGESPFRPDYVLPIPALRAEFVDSPLIMYLRSQRIRVTDGESLGAVYDSYFNRTYEHFCSHQHTPPQPSPSGFDCGVQKGNILYLSHPVFSLYRGLGAVACKQYVAKAIARLLNDDRRLLTNLPSMSRVSLTEQAAEDRHVLHLLHANTITRGGPMELSGGSVAGKLNAVEVIDELLPVHDVQVQVKLDRPVTRVTLEPEGRDVAFRAENGMVTLRVKEVRCHQMVVFHHS